MSSLEEWKLFEKTLILCFLFICEMRKFLSSSRTSWALNFLLKLFHWRTWNHYWKFEVFCARTFAKINRIAIYFSDTSQIAVAWMDFSLLMFTSMKFLKNYKTWWVFKFEKWENQGNSSWKLFEQRPENHVKEHNFSLLSWVYLTRSDVLRYISFMKHFFIRKISFFSHDTLKMKKFISSMSFLSLNTDGPSGLVYAKSFLIDYGIWISCDTFSCFSLILTSLTLSVFFSWVNHANVMSTRMKSNLSGERTRNAFCNIEDEIIFHRLNVRRGRQQTLIENVLNYSLARAKMSLELISRSHRNPRHSEWDWLFHLLCSHHSMNYHSNLKWTRKWWEMSNQSSLFSYPKDAS